MVLTDETKLAFESSVNSEGIETTKRKNIYRNMFESSVNSEGIETKQRIYATKF